MSFRRRTERAISIANAVSALLEAWVDLVTEARDGANWPSDITPASELLLNDILAGAARISHEMFVVVGYTQPHETQASAYPDDINLGSSTDINTLSPAASANSRPSSTLHWYNATTVPAGMRAPPSSPSSFASPSTPATSLPSE
ncbi:hypothetical protein CVT26_012676 [Gymnopilus dilepis]|uniref:Uncharacterized protein n=1 Tax=Gymnopilus dilepis TaxID=231916 RepID=A0A409WAP7_9AGAR|nr:hypothetical protein CVT26_012676 [Gymnopilus dilepis]